MSRNDIMEMRGIGAGQQLLEDGIGYARFFASRHCRAPLLRSCPTSARNSCQSPAYLPAASVASLTFKSANFEVVPTLPLYRAEAPRER